MSARWVGPRASVVGPWLLAAVAVAGCTQKAQLAPAALTVDPTTLDFGSVPVDTSSTLDVTLSNSGQLPATVLTVSLIEGDPNRFVIDHDSVDTIEGGADAQLAITFKPRDVGAVETGQVQIRTDAADDPFLVTLTGKGGDSSADNDGDGYSAADGDCDDYDPNRHPGADEICDGKDDDCNGTTPGDEADADYDGSHLCDDDCDDNDGQVHPGAQEICDGKDDDCDGVTPDNDDQDKDGSTICDGDCDDSKPNVNPGRPEVCDGDDNDCDGNVDNVDADGDGHTLCSAAGDCDDTDPNAFPVVVSTSGSSYGTGTDDDPYDSLDTALGNLDSVCRTVVVESGTYYDVAVSWTSGSVTIIGRTGNPADVTLRAAQYDRQFYVEGATLDLRDLTLSDGDANEDGGAIQVVNGTLTLDHVVLSNNASGNDGGAIASASSSLDLHNVTFDSNTATDDGGAMAVNASTLTDDGSTYTNNSGVNGGALYVSGGDISLDGVTIRSNDATEGGGISFNDPGTYNVERSSIVLNHSTANGGGIALRGVLSDGSIRNDRIQDNVADAEGGGIGVLGTSAAGEIANCTITGNTSTGVGGGIAIDVSNGGSLIVTNNVLHSDDGPAALWMATGASSQVTYNTAYLANSGVDFGGDLIDAYGVPLDPTNVVRDPRLTAFSDDGNPDNDDLTLSGSSSEIDSGNPDPRYNDQNGTTNDRGYTGGPAAP